MVAAQPAHLLLEGMAFTTGQPFVTLHKVRDGIAPFRVDNDQVMIESLAGLGYQLVRRWRDGLAYAQVPVVRDGRIDLGYGMHFRHGASGPVRRARQ